MKKIIFLIIAITVMASALTAKPDMIITKEKETYVVKVHGNIVFTTTNKEELIKYQYKEPWTGVIHRSKFDHYEYDADGHIIATVCYFDNWCDDCAKMAARAF